MTTIEDKNIFSSRDQILIHKLICTFVATTKEKKDTRPNFQCGLPSGTLGTRGYFSRAAGTLFLLKVEPTSGEAVRKASGPERYDLPFPLKFDLFWQISFKPIKSNISNSNHMDWHVKK